MPEYTLGEFDDYVRSTYDSELVVTLPPSTRDRTVSIYQQGAGRVRLVGPLDYPHGRVPATHGQWSVIRATWVKGRWALRGDMAEENPLPKINVVPLQPLKGRYDLLGEDGHYLV